MHITQKGKKVYSKATRSFWYCNSKFRNNYDFLRTSEAEHFTKGKRTSWDVSSCSRKEKLVPCTPLSFFYFYSTWFWEKHLGFRYHRRAGACNTPVDFFLERAEQTVGAGMQKEPSQRPGAWWKFSPTSGVNCLLMKAYASHLLTTQELEWVQKQPKTDMPSNRWCERCDPYSVYPMDFGRAEHRPRHRRALRWQTRSVSLSRVNCHCPVTTGTLPVEFVYSLILISGESSGLHPAANCFNKQHLSWEEGNMILQWEHVTETSISGYDLGLLQSAALQRDSFKRQDRIQSKCKKQLPAFIWRLLTGQRKITTVKCP